MERSSCVPRPPNIRLYWPRMMMDVDERGAVGGFGGLGGMGNRSTRRKLAPVPHFPPQIPHDLTRDRIRSVAFGPQLLTA
jgi:hypothetical protein